MTENDIKEDISRSFLEIIANRTGYYSWTAKKDFGVDVRYTKSVADNHRYLEQPWCVSIQLKSTTEKGVTVVDDYIKYPLEAKTYNDLVSMSRHVIPLILVLFILPENENEWVKLTSNDLVVKKCAYWFTLENGTEKTTNTHKVTISIPQSNLIDLSFFNNLYNLYC